MTVGTPYAIDQPGGAIGQQVRLSHNRVGTIVDTRQYEGESYVVEEREGERREVGRNQRPSTVKEIRTGQAYLVSENIVGEPNEKVYEQALEEREYRPSIN